MHTGLLRGHHSDNGYGDFGARGGTRTPTVARWILNPVRLPIPPLSRDRCQAMTNVVAFKLMATKKTRPFAEVTSDGQSRVH